MQSKNSKKKRKNKEKKPKTKTKTNRKRNKPQKNKPSLINQSMICSMPTIQKKSKPSKNTNTTLKKKIPNPLPSSLTKNSKSTLLSPLNWEPLSHHPSENLSNLPGTLPSNFTVLLWVIKGGSGLSLFPLAIRSSPQAQPIEQLSFGILLQVS